MGSAEAPLCIELLILRRKVSDKFSHLQVGKTESEERYMKTLQTFLIMTSLVLMSCSPNADSGGIDLGSLSGDTRFHEQTETAVSGGTEYSYVWMELKSDQSFEQSEAIFNQAGAGTKCSLKGTWTVVPGDVNAGTGNVLVISVTEVNGGAVTQKKRYDLTQLSSQTLKLNLSASTSVRDLTNTDYVTYPEYASLNTAGLSVSAFCDR
jgi:hypothetical protein